LLEVEVGLLLVLFVELQVQRAGQVPVRPLVHVVERQEVHRKLLERLHALATLFVTLQGCNSDVSRRGGAGVKDAARRGAG